MTTSSTCQRMIHYMAWANRVTLDNAAQLPVAELHAPRDALFKTISGTFDHILVVEEIFMAHLLGKEHGFTARTRDEDLPFSEVSQRLRALDEDYIALVKSWDDATLEEVIPFEFVGGGSGAMSREDIVLHLSTHSNYHRGFISTLLYPFKLKSAASDLPVFLRDVWPDIVKNGQ